MSERGRPVTALVTDQVELDEPRHGVVPFRTRPDRIESFSNGPGLVCDRPRPSSLARSGASRRSIVACDIASSATSASSVITCCWKRRSLGTNSAVIGASRFPVGAPSTAQQNASAAMISAP